MPYVAVIVDVILKEYPNINVTTLLSGIKFTNLLSGINFKFKTFMYKKHIIEFIF